MTLHEQSHGFRIDISTSIDRKTPYGLLITFTFTYSSIQYTIVREFCNVLLSLYERVSNTIVVHLSLVVRSATITRMWSLYLGDKRRSILGTVVEFKLILKTKYLTFSSTEIQVFLTQFSCPFSIVYYCLYALNCLFKCMIYSLILYVII